MSELSKQTVTLLKSHRFSLNQIIQLFFFSRHYRNLKPKSNVFQFTTFKVNFFNQTHNRKLNQMASELRNNYFYKCELSTEKTFS